VKEQRGERKSKEKGKGKRLARGADEQGKIMGWKLACPFSFNFLLSNSSAKSR
jgi:hypothetical protein